MGVTKHCKVLGREKLRCSALRGPYIMGPMLRAGLVLLFSALSLCGQADYTRDVQPLLEKRCYVCHGPQQQMSNLRLDQKDAAMRVIQPGKSDQSRLIRMVSGQEAKVMPPVGAKLTAAEIALL